MIKRWIVTLLFAGLCTSTALASKVDASLIPDGNYEVTVEQVADSSHVTVRMQNGVEVDFKAAKATVTFSSSTPSHIKIFIVQGEIVFYAKA